MLQPELVSGLLCRSHTTARSVRMSCTAGWEFGKGDGFGLGKAQVKPLRCDPRNMAWRLLAAVPPSCTALQLSEALVTSADQVLGSISCATQG